VLRRAARILTHISIAVFGLLIGAELGQILLTALRLL
jgi:hypothetical protein